MKVINRPSISIVLCHYYLKQALLEKLVKNILKSKLFIIKSIVIVHNNSGAINDFKFKDVIHHISGSNQLLDFSAYREGLEYLRANKLDDAALFLNDTLFTKLPYHYILKRLSKTIFLSQSLNVPCLVSFRANYDFFLQSNPWSGASSHFCAAVFYANSEASSLLVNSYDNLRKECSFNQLSDALIEKITGKQFFGYLRLVLFNEKSRWQPELTQSKLEPLIFKKALCFYLEHYLSALVQQSDGGIIYINNGKYFLSFKIYSYISFISWKARMLIRSMILK